MYFADHHPYYTFVTLSEELRDPQTQQKI